jgi:hypothetical protein
MFLVRHKTAHILSLQSLIVRCRGQRISSNQLHIFKRADLKQLLKEKDQVISAQTNLDSIAFIKNRFMGWRKSLKTK